MAINDDRKDTDPVARMNVAVQWLALEVPAEIWDDINARWQAVTRIIPNEHPDV
jgi:hypothetical protein